MGHGKKKFPKNKQELKRIKIRTLLKNRASLDDIIQIVGTSKPTVFGVKKNLKQKCSLWRKKGLGRLLSINKNDNIRIDRLYSEILFYQL